MVWDDFVNNGWFIWVQTINFRASICLLVGHAYYISFDADLVFNAIVFRPNAHSIDQRFPTFFCSHTPLWAVQICFIENLSVFLKEMITWRTPWDFFTYPRLGIGAVDGSWNWFKFKWDQRRDGTGRDGTGRDETCSKLGLIFFLIV